MAKTPKRKPLTPAQILQYKIRNEELTPSTPTQAALMAMLYKVKPTLTNAQFVAVAQLIRS